MTISPSENRIIGVQRHVMAEDELTSRSKVARAIEGWNRHRDLVLRRYPDHAALRPYLLRDAWWMQWDGAPAIGPVGDVIWWEGHGLLRVDRVLASHLVPIVTVRIGGEAFDCLRMSGFTDDDNARLATLAEDGLIFAPERHIEFHVVDIGAIRYFDLRKFTAEVWRGQDALAAVKLENALRQPAPEIFTWVLAPEVALLLDAAFVARLRAALPEATTMFVYIDQPEWKPPSLAVPGVQWLLELPIVVETTGARRVRDLLDQVRSR